MFTENINKTLFKSMNIDPQNMFKEQDGRHRAQARMKLRDKEEGDSSGFLVH